MEFLNTSIGIIGGLMTIIGGLYAFWQWIEPRIPRFPTSPPSYTPPAPQPRVTPPVMNTGTRINGIVFGIIFWGIFYAIFWEFLVASTFAGSWWNGEDPQFFIYVLLSICGPICGVVYGTIVGIIVGEVKGTIKTAIYGMIGGAVSGVFLFLVFAIFFQYIAVTDFFTYEELQVFAKLSIAGSTYTGGIYGMIYQEIYKWKNP